MWEIHEYEAWTHFETIKGHANMNRRYIKLHSNNFYIVVTGNLADAPFRMIGSIYLESTDSIKGLSFM